MIRFYIGNFSYNFAVMEATLQLILSELKSLKEQVNNNEALVKERILNEAGTSSKWPKPKPSSRNGAHKSFNKYLYETRGEEAPQQLVHITEAFAQELCNIYGDFDGGLTQFTYMHYFPDGNIMDDFIEYITSKSNGMVYVYPYRCTHRSHAGRYHGHVIVRVDNEYISKLKNRMLNFARYIKNKHKDMDKMKKTDRVPILNAVHLVNTIIYIQTREGKERRGVMFDHEEHTYLPVVFDNRMQARGFKTNYLCTLIPNFKEIEYGYVAGNGLGKKSRSNDDIDLNDLDSVLSDNE